MPETTASTMPSSLPGLSAATAQPMTSLASSSQVSTSVLSKSLKITGQLESTENIQIEGEVDGDVRAISVKVGANAKVKGTVYGEEVELAGTVDGKIEAKKVILTRTAHMSGDIVHQDISIESGAFLDGHCRPEFGKTSAKSNPLAYKPAPREVSSSSPASLSAAAEKSNGAAAKA